MATELTTAQWMEILVNPELTNELDMAIFQTLYDFEKYQAFASQIALILGTHHGVLNFEVGRYAKRISTIYDIDFTIRSSKKYKYWDLFFNGWDEGTKFVWQLKDELIIALEKTSLMPPDRLLPDEIPNNIAGALFEGVKKTVIVNSYERNTKARELCIKHWQAICSVCNFEFEKIYGELGKHFIHVHHLIPIWEIGKSYQVDPINDLRPVCPNCHAMLHKKEPPLKIEELKSIINLHSATLRHNTSDSF